MNSPFKPGDRAVVIRDDYDPSLVGHVVTIMSPLRRIRWSTRPECVGNLVHEVDLPPDGPVTWTYEPAWLAKYEADDREAVEWTDELSRICGRGVTA